MGPTEDRRVRAVELALEWLQTFPESSKGLLEVALAIDEFILKGVVPPRKG